MQLIFPAILLFILLAFAPVAVAAADPAPPGTDLAIPGEAPIEATQDASGRHCKLHLSAEGVGRSGIDGSASSFAYREYAAGLEYLFLLLDVDQRDYDWRHGSTGVANPWRSLTRIAPGVQYYRELGDRWGVWAKFIGIAGFEDSLSSRSWTYNPQVLGFYSPSPALTYYAGVGMLYHPVESVPYPVLGMAWNMGSARGLGVAVGFPETMVRYRYDEQWALKFDFQWDIRTYSLAADNPLAAQGYLQTEDRIPALALEFTPVKGLTLAPGIRWYLGRSMTLYDRDEFEQAAMDPHSAWAASFTIRYLFP